MQAIGVLLVGIAALAALIFSGLSTNATRAEISATGDQLQISEQGQITGQYNAAITDLGSSFVDVRLGGIYALRGIMQDAPRDQPTVVAVLCAFVRDHAKPSTAPPPISPVARQVSPDPSHDLPTDIQAALTVVSTRDASHDGSATVIDLSHVNLAGADLSGAQLARANFAGADLTGADLTGADLSGADLSLANLDGVELLHADLTGARLTTTDFAYADLAGADLAGANLAGVFLTRSQLADADLAGAIFTGISSPS